MFGAAPLTSLQVNELRKLTLKPTLDSIRLLKTSVPPPFNRINADSTTASVAVLRTKSVSTITVDDSSPSVNTPYYMWNRGESNHKHREYILTISANVDICPCAHLLCLPVDLSSLKQCHRPQLTPLQKNLRMHSKEKGGRC